MPLRVEPVTISIVGPTIEESFEEAVEPALLAVPEYGQRAEEWCWAACVQMILAYYGVKVDQCDIVNRRFNSTVCCQDPEDPSCNAPLSVVDVAMAYRDWNKSAVCIQSTDITLIENEISAGRPLQVGLVWNDGSAHAAVVCGASEGEFGPILQVNDPKYGAGSVYQQNLELAYGGGSWQYTWYSIK